MEPEALNKKALDIVQRVRDKLTGRDFNKEVGTVSGMSRLLKQFLLQESLKVAEQVDLLIVQATSHENLCQCYIGWCPFW